MAKGRFSITAIIGVDSSKMRRGLARAAGNMKAWAKRSMRMVVTAVAAGVALATAALARFAVKAVKEFASFEHGMNEVFTLIPGISKKAMEKMIQDVNKTAIKMRVLPEEVVPALYQALSAGVPPGNVFDFMEVAIKGAKAGVATTVESVELLTSVVNSYNKVGLKAAEASDIIFTTIRLGKTTFKELSAALYNVAPAAAAADVSFADVSSAIAAMTKQGVPTKIATTQIRQGIISLLTPNVTMGKVMAENGVTMKQLADTLQKPGGLLKALLMVKKAAGGNVGTMKRMFGRVEALQGALILTSNGGKVFSEVMGQMSGAAGATDEAYDKMKVSLTEVFKEVHARLKIAMVGMGKSLMPFVRAAVPFVERIIGLINKIPWTKILQGFARVWLGGIKPYFEAIIKMLQNLPWHHLISYLMPIAKMVIKTIQNLGGAIIRLAPMIIPGLQMLAGYFAFLMSKFYLMSKMLFKFAPLVAQIFRAVFQSLALAFNFIIDPSKEKFEFLVKFIKHRFARLWKLAGIFILKIKDEMIKGFQFIWGAIKAGFKTLFSGLWAEIKTFIGKHTEIQTAVDDMKSTFRKLKEEIVPVLQELKRVFDGVMNSISEQMGNTSLEGDRLNGLISLLIATLSYMIQALTALVEMCGKVVIAVMRIWAAVGPLAKDVFPALKTAVKFLLGVFAAWLAIQALVMVAVTGLVFIVSKLISSLLALTKYLSPVINAIKIWYMAIWDITKKVWKGIWEAYKKYVSFMIDDWTHLLIFIKESLKMLPSVFQQAWDKIKGGFQTLKTLFTMITDLWKTAFSIIWETAKNALTPIFNLFDYLKKKVYEVLFGGTVTKDFKKAFEFIGSLVSRVIGAIIAAFDRMKNIVSGIFGGIFKLAEKVLGFASKIGKGAGKALGGILGRLGGGGEMTAPGMGTGNTPLTGTTLNASLRPIVEKLTSMDITLKSIDRKLSGKFVNQ